MVRDIHNIANILVYYDETCIHFFPTMSTSEILMTHAIRPNIYTLQLQMVVVVVVFFAYTLLCD